MFKIKGRRTENVNVILIRYDHSETSFQEYFVITFN
jgi:hypothetical protein